MLRMIPPGVPLTVRQRLDRPICIGHAGLEKREQVEAADGDDPEQEEGNRTEVIQRIEPVAERRVEQRLDPHEQRLHHALQKSDHGTAVLASTARTARTARMT